MGATESRERAMTQPVTAREIAMLEWAATGAGDSLIAAELRLSVNTVKNYFHYLYAKMGADNRAHAVAMAMRRGLIK